MSHLHATHFLSLAFQLQKFVPIPVELIPSQGDSSSILPRLPHLSLTVFIFTLTSTIYLVTKLVSNQSHKYPVILYHLVNEMHHDLNWQHGRGRDRNFKHRYSEVRSAYQVK
jgi:hypothetical protein